VEEWGTMHLAVGVTIMIPVLLALQIEGVNPVNLSATYSGQIDGFGNELPNHLPIFLGLLRNVPVLSLWYGKFHDCVWSNSLNKVYFNLFLMLVELLTDYTPKLEYSVEKPKAADFKPTTYYSIFRTGFLNFNKFEK